MALESCDYLLHLMWGQDKHHSTMSHLHSELLSLARHHRSKDAISQAFPFFFFKTKAGN